MGEFAVSRTLGNLPDKLHMSLPDLLFGTSLLEFSSNMIGAIVSSPVDDVHDTNGSSALRREMKINSI
jgi:hypothetical protein